jgi:uncharacterized protein (TIGR03083 family)
MTWSTVLTAALSRRPSGFPDLEALPPEAVPYGVEVRKLDLLLEKVTPREWRTPVLPGLTTQGLVSHLADNDAKLAVALEVAVSAAWRTQAFALLRCALTVPLSRRVDVDGLSLPVRNAYLARAFETWIHADDIRLATGRPADPPCPSHLRALADLHIRSLPAALKLSGRPRPDRTVLIRLTGAFVREWRIPLSRNASPEPAVALTADALEFCYLAANRRTPGSVPIAVVGDPLLAENLLAVMTFFSHEPPNSG